MLLGRSVGGTRRKQMAPMSSSTGLATPVPMELQQGERQGRARKRTVGQILADEASALPQPAAAKRQRKAAGAYKYLDGAEDMDLDGGQKKGAPRAQAGRPRRRHKAARRRAAATPKAVTIHQEDSEASSAARGLVMLSGSSSSSSPGSSCSNAAQVNMARNSPSSVCGGGEGTPALAGTSSDEDNFVLPRPPLSANPDNAAADMLLDFASHRALPASF